MRSLFHLLLFAMLLAPASAQALRPALEVCAEVNDECCEPEQACDDVCVECPCCAAGAVTLDSPVIAGVLDGPPALEAAARAKDPPVAPRTEILHVPKSA